MSHLEIYNKILDLPGDILEFGVYNNGSANPFTFYMVYEASDSTGGSVGAETNSVYHDNLNAGGAGPRVELWDGSTYRDWQAEFTS